jgi:hypothetical protein
MVNKCLFECVRAVRVQEVLSITGKGTVCKVSQECMRFKMCNIGQSTSEGL